MEIIGKLTRTIYYNKDNNYTIALIYTTSDEYVTIKGFIKELEADVNYLFIGEFENNAKYGKQFKVESYKINNNDKDSLITFLASDKFPGIGVKTATKIIESLGENALDIIASDRSSLDKIKGLSAEKKDYLHETLKNLSLTDSALIKLYDLGLSHGSAIKLLSKYDVEIIDIIYNNPYFLLDEHIGFGFKKCDQLAMNMGFSTTDPLRIEAGLIYVVNEACYESGSTYILEETLITKAADVLDISDISLIKMSLIKLVQNKRLVSANERIFDSQLFNAEIRVSVKLKELNNNKESEFSKEAIIKKLTITEDVLKIKYTTLQKEAIINALSSKLAIITGGPGTGKTTIVKGILYTYAYLLNLDVDDEAFCPCLLAPTGRAAKRLNESTRISASTIHKGLGYKQDGGFSFDEYNQLPYKLYIIDEASMIDIRLADSLLKAIPNNAHVIFIGDQNQLPSVGPGNFLKDIIDSNIIRTVKLEEVMRQVADSAIIKLANMVLNENLSLDILNDRKEVFYYNALRPSFKIILKRILDNYLASNNDLANIQILIPMYNGDVGIDEVNSFIQKEYNPNKDIKYEKNGKLFYKNDRVLQLVNRPDLDIMNGDVGQIIDINEGELLVEFNEKVVTLAKTDLNDLTLAYAISIHKSQGSEYPYVIMPIFSSYYIMLDKNLIYTAITRAKKKLILIGDCNNIVRYMSIIKAKRHTALSEFLNPNQKSATDSKEIRIYDDISAFDRIIDLGEDVRIEDFLTDEYLD